MSCPQPPTHEPVMLAEVLEYLVTDRAGRYLDATVGLGGHTAAILRELAPQGRVLGLEADPEALAIASERLAAYTGGLELVQANFRDAGDILTERGFTPISGALFDLGVCSYQIQRGGRGFSFASDAPLDMRLDPKGSLTAADVVNTWSQPELVELLRACGERAAERLARAIVCRRQAKPFSRTGELVELAARFAGRGRLHPATLLFLALRITVNRELENLEQALQAIRGHLTAGGRIAVLSYHSLEDRIVKRAFRNWSREGGFRVVTPKPISPTVEERSQTPRARSAKLRVVEKLG